MQSFILTLRVSLNCGIENCHGEPKLMCESCTIIEKQLDKYKNRTDEQKGQIERVEVKAGKKIRG